jgi:hypothetical protein
MELKNNTVWIVSDNDDMTVFTSEKYAEEHKAAIIETWKKSIIRDVIPRRLNNGAEIEKYGKDYPHVIQVGNDHYGLVKHLESCGLDRESKRCWYYDLMSNAEWDAYYRDIDSEIVINNHIIIK